MGKMARSAAAYQDRGVRWLPWRPLGATIHGVGGNLAAALAVIVLLAALVGAVFAVVRLRARRGIATATQRATYEVLHIAG
ncbi:MAG: sensor histidine kinase, partial [Mycobacterium sp.]|nr:sensor histidine kinase [Mycobacterium sp.]